MSLRAEVIQEKVNLNGILPSVVIEDLVRVEEELRKQLQTPSKFVRYINEHILSWKGKRLRPIMVLVIARAYNLHSEAVIHLACAIEMIHTATLVHDDVIDEAKLRRFKRTVNAQWDNEISILAGDYLFSQASYILAKEVPSQVTQLISSGVKDTCQGEIEQLCHRKNQNLSESEYLNILEKKTGSLFSVSCTGPAMMADAPEEDVAALASYGLKLGTAFQIVDDYLDFVSTEKELGKPVGNDFDNGKLTLPLIHTLRSANLEGEGLELGNIFDKSRSEIISLSNKYKSPAYCLETAKEYIYQAKDKLQTMDNQSVRQTLDLLADYVMERNC